MTYLLVKVGVNKSLTLIKSIFKTLMISYYNGKVRVCLRGGTVFESCHTHVINILIFSVYLFMHN